VAGTAALMVTVPLLNLDAQMLRRSKGLPLLQPIRRSKGVKAPNVLLDAALMLAGTAALMTPTVLLLQLTAL
jgi:hypothetical protein